MTRPRSRRSLVALAALATSALGCPNTDIVPLVGEDPEVHELIGEADVDDPRSSPLGAARRLHQAIIQQDTDLAWSLLSSATREVLDARGEAIGTSGRELLDASTLPGPGGSVRKVRFEDVLFVADLEGLELPAPPVAGDASATVVARSAAGRTVERRFVLEEGLWRLHLIEI